MSDETSIASYTTKVAEQAAGKNFDKSLKFVITANKDGSGEAGVIFLDGSGEGITVNNDDGEAACTLTISNKNFGVIMSNPGKAMSLFMTGKIKLKGDMGVAMGLQKVLS